jgi:pimeloyl-ACP methyl ester carboxylesterase
MNKQSSVWIPLSWGRMRVHVSGSGPPLLALHGLAGSGRYWQGLADELGDGATIVAPDLAGFGASDKPDVSYDREFHLASLDAAIETLGLGLPRIVAGHSMGGILAALWAARHPTDIDSLALVASPFPAARTRASDWETRGLSSLTHRTLQALWPILTFPYRSSVYPRAVVADYMRHTRASYWRTAHVLLWDPAVVDEVAPLLHLNQRRLLLYARDDRQVGLSSMQSWAALLPGACTEVLDSGRHQLLLASRFVPLARWIRGQTGEEAS